MICKTLFLADCFANATEGFGVEVTHGCGLAKSQPALID